MNFDKIQKYLPSKKFQKFIGAFLVIGIFVFVVFFIFSSQKESFSNYKQDLAVNNVTVNELLVKDTDGDGVADWEEQFWGTDKNNKFTFEGISDFQYVENKRTALNGEQEIENRTLTQTDIFAREFFPALLALNSEGVDQDTINNFSTALGQKILNPEIKVLYFESDIKINNTEDGNSRLAYYKKVQATFNKFKDAGIGNELNIISQGLLSYSNEGKTGQSAELLLVGGAYQDFAKEILAVSVPSSLSEAHLQIINSAHNVGETVINMSEVIGDPIVGLSALSAYEKYSQDLIDAVNNLEEKLEQVI
ncbi:MAG: hypothetical protein WC011_03775 [Candidatus Paceibacterota bacterium]